MIDAKDDVTIDSDIPVYLFLLGLVMLVLLIIVMLVFEVKFFSYSTTSTTTTTTSINTIIVSMLLTTSFIHAFIIFVKYRLL